MSFAPDEQGAIVRSSPNYWAGRSGHEPQIIVAHGTAGSSPGCVSWLCDTQSGASAHYIVDRAGTIYQLVPESAAAWANGIPELPSPYYGGTNPNLFSLSIEAERPDPDNSTPLTDVQIAAITRLVRGMRTRWGPLPLIPHSAISPQSRARCPGAGYPLAQINAAGAVATELPTGPITWVRFNGAPQRQPLIFYAGASFEHPLYRSAATEQTPLQFDGWQDGAPVPDPHTKAPSRRWYHRHNPLGEQGWVPASWIKGSVP